MTQRAAREAVVEVRGLTKRYGDVAAVDGVDLTVHRGEVFGFLGPNGAGKTTTLRMMLGLVSPSDGHVAVLGHQPGDPRSLRRTGSLIEGPGFYPYLSGRANLAVLARYAGVPASRVATALEVVDLAARRDDKFGTYSLGMKQRLGVAAALLKEPEVVVLDEPTNGLDPQGTREVRHLIGTLAREGATVLVSSHLLSEVEQMCTHLGVMREGRLVAQGTVTEVRGRGIAGVRVDTPSPDAAAAVLVDLGVQGVAAEAAVVRGVLGSLEPEKLVAALVHAGVPVQGFAVTAPSLEDLFVSLTGEGFDVSG